MNTKAFFPCGGGSNLIFGTGRKNQTIIFNTCIIFEKKIRMEKFLSEKKFVRKKTCWENNFCQKKFYWEKIVLEKYLSEETCWKNNLRKKFIETKKLLENFLSESGGCDKHDLICIFVYQMGRLCGGAHEISDIKAPLFLHGWVVGVCW